MPRGVKVKEIEVITAEEKPEWDKLIEKTKLVVNTQDKSMFDLVILAGQVDKKYGENRVALWADEAGLSFSQAKQYRWMANKGVDAAFVKKWARTKANPDGLSYSVIREVIAFHGSSVSPHAIRSLEWAVEHKATVVGIRGYMLELNAPHRNFEDREEAFRAAMKDKQEHEGFSDFVASKLIELAMEHPAAEEAILSTVIVGRDDMEKLEVAAGVVSGEELEIEREAMKFLRKMRAMKAWFDDNEKLLATSIALGHIHSDELRDAAKYVADAAFNAWNTEAIEYDTDDVKVVEIRKQAS